MREPFDFDRAPETRGEGPPPKRSGRTREEKPFGGDLLFFGAVFLTFCVPLVGIAFGLIDMGGRSPERRMKGLGLLLFGLTMAILYAIFLTR